MEKREDWLEMSRKLLPSRYEKFGDSKFSPAVEDCYSMFRGVHYRDIPLRGYDFFCGWAEVRFAGRWGAHS